MNKPTQGRDMTPEEYEQLSEEQKQQLQMLKQEAEKVKEALKKRS